MAQRSLSISISVPIEMDENVRESAEKHDMTYSQYVRHCIRSHSSNPIDEPNVHLAVDENGKARNQKGGAA
jgi:predicted DNA-binding protein